jgi:hypothetical protein
VNFFFFFKIVFEYFFENKLKILKYYADGFTVGTTIYADGQSVPTVIGQSPTRTMPTTLCRRSPSAQPVPTAF